MGGQLQLWLCRVRAGVAMRMQARCCNVQAFLRTAAVVAWHWRHCLQVCGLKWSPCGQQLASGGNDNALCIWDSQFRLVHKLNAHQVGAQRTCGRAPAAALCWPAGLSLAAASVRYALCRGATSASSPSAAHHHTMAAVATLVRPTPGTWCTRPAGRCQGCGLVPLPEQPGGHWRRHSGPVHQVLEHAHRRVPQQHRHGLTSGCALQGGLLLSCTALAAAVCTLAGAHAPAQVCALQWNRHEREILSSHGYSKNQLCLWKYPSLAKVGELTGHQGRALHMATSPDGSTVVSAGARLAQPSRRRAAEPMTQRAHCGCVLVRVRAPEAPPARAGADETLRFWRVFGEPALAKDEKAGLLAGGGGMLAGGAPLGGLRSIR